MEFAFSQGTGTGLPVIDENGCSRCGACAEVCPVGVLSSGSEHISVNPDAGFGCIACAHGMTVCPSGSATVTGRGARPGVPAGAAGGGGTGHRRTAGGLSAHARLHPAPGPGDRGRAPQRRRQGALGRPGGPAVQSLRLRRCHRRRHRLHLCHARGGNPGTGLLHDRVPAVHSGQAQGPAEEIRKSRGPDTGPWVDPKLPGRLLPKDRAA